MKSVMHWSKASSIIVGMFLIILVLIGYIWWPLLDAYIQQYDPAYPIWLQIDWLLIGNFFVMSILITLNVNLKHDIPLAAIGLAGGFIIEAWGTLSGLWTYYTFETPPLWIIPAWPIAALSVNRLFKMAQHWTRKIPESVFSWGFWPVFGIFLILLIDFIWPTRMHPLTIFSFLLCVLIIFMIKKKRDALLIFIMGSALGYFLERWGTTRLCWTYYTGGTPPFFTVLAHGMASVAIWWFYQVYLWIISQSRFAWVRSLNPELDNP